MKAVELALNLKPGAYPEYKRRHDELWPELAEVMRQLGVSMVIYRHEQTLFVYGTAPSDQAWADLDKHAVTPRWNAYMAEVLETDAQGGIVFIPLQQAFKFGALS